MRKWLLHLSISAAVLGLLFWRGRVWDLGSSFRDFEVWGAVVVLALNLPILLLITLRSWLVLERAYGPASFWRLIPISAVGNLAGQLTPANAGDLWRAYAYKSEYGLPAARGVAAVVYERLMSFYLMGLVAAGLALHQFLLRDFGPGTLVLIALGVMAMAFLPALTYRVLRPAIVNNSWTNILTPLVERTPLRSLKSAFQEGEEGLRLLFGDLRLTLSFAGSTALYLSLSGLQVWVIVEALDAGLGFEEAWLVLIAAAVIGAASSLPFGLGITDGALVLLLGTYGVSVGLATTLAILMRGLVTLPLGLVAVAFYLFLAPGSPTARGEITAAGVPDTEPNPRTY